MLTRTKLTAAVTLALLAAPALPAGAFPLGKKKAAPAADYRKPTAAQNALIDKAIAREAVVVKTLKERTPIVETYIQNMKTDAVMGQTPESDVHFLGRVNFGKVINDNSFAEGTKPDEKGSKVGGLFKHSLGYLTGLSSSLHMSYNQAGFVQMLLVDSNSFNRTMYQFSFVRNDFLGTIPTVVFDVAPSKGQTSRFFGRIWIERNSGNIVRFNGDFTGSEKDIREFYHFDSWRTNVQEGLWLPTSVYIEETDPKSPSHTLEVQGCELHLGLLAEGSAEGSRPGDARSAGRDRCFGRCSGREPAAGAARVGSAGRGQRDRPLVPGRFD